MPRIILLSIMSFGAGIVNKIADVGVNVCKTLNNEQVSETEMVMKKLPITG
ncbi:hypothetical protein [Photorhabdus asymbiotica]|uniref:hypothetical protein n=1 Tax=Photorhabdus asymbiotica TaxID=291112 RepID=UPI003DA724D7